MKEKRKRKCKKSEKEKKRKFNAKILSVMMIRVEMGSKVFYPKIGAILEEMQF